jgi:hypothetical protein
MLFFIAYIVLYFPDNVDLSMFQGKLFHISFTQVQNMSALFNVFKGFSAYVYLSLFWGYLVLNLILMTILWKIFKKISVEDLIILSLIIILIVIILVVLNINNPINYLMGAVFLNLLIITIFKLL